jgi:hypothetical protein
MGGVDVLLRAGNEREVPARRGFSFLAARRLLLRQFGHKLTRFLK